MRKFRKIMLWIATNGLFAVVLFYYLADNISWCGNVCKFMTIAYTVLLVIGLLAPEKELIRQLTKEPIFPVYDWIEYTYDFGVVIAWAAFGHFGYATLWLAQAFLCKNQQQRLEHCWKLKNKVSKKNAERAFKDALGV